MVTELTLSELGESQSASELGATTEQFTALAGTPFNGIDRSQRQVAYGVAYNRLLDSSGGCLWVTPHGWRCLRSLDPALWFAGGQYRRRGRELSDGSGAVFRVSSIVNGSPPVDLVVKFSRMAQNVQMDVSSTFPGGMARHELDSAAFNNPFQEFGLLEELRCSDFGPPDLRVLTKRPLAIYSPGRTFGSWQLGRSEDHFRRIRHQLAAVQEHDPIELDPIELSIDRQYIVLFEWVKGTDAQQMADAGKLSRQQTDMIVRTAVDEMAAKGFRVLDMKPNHVILRERRGQVVRRRGKPIYAMVDFELLQRTTEYEEWRRKLGSARIGFLGTQ